MAKQLVRQERVPELHAWMKVWISGKSYSVSILFDKAETQPWTLAQNLPTISAAEMKLREYRQRFLANKA